MTSYNKRNIQDAFTDGAEASNLISLEMNWIENENI